jgi:putative IMPACT (imprinted ancient) family translation regulator
LGQIRSNQLTNVACIVVRYYGGSKLGVPGLINAYKLASSGAITSMNLIPYRESITINVVGPYGTLMKFLGVCHHNMWEARLDKYNEKPMIQLTIETESAQGVLDKISLFSELTRID